MKNCIITPTFKDHFCFIDNYLNSFITNVEHAKDMPIAFILSNQEEVEQIDKIIKPYKEKLNIECYNIEEILKKFNIKKTSKELLKRYGSRSYQTIKKIYSMLHIDAERFFVLDCESVWIKKTNMKKVFDDFFNNPFIVVSDWKTRTEKESSMEEHFAVANFVCGKKMEKMFFEHFMWFYKKEMIVGLCEEYGYPVQLCEKVYQWETQKNVKPEGLMELLMCMNYIYEHREQLGYKVIQVENELNKYLGEKLTNQYIKRFFDLWKGGRLGILEFPFDMLNKKNYLKLAKLHSDNGIIVSRCDGTVMSKIKVQKEFIDKSQIKILAVNQEHIYVPQMTEKQKKKLIKDYTNMFTKFFIKTKLKNLVNKHK